jgi:hypothetical protein
MGGTRVTDHDVFLVFTAAALRTIVEEDVSTQEAMQRGHRSRLTPPATLSWLEATIPQMNRWLVARDRSALDAPASTE